jgi:hypothetical protein
LIWLPWVFERELPGVLRSFGDEAFMPLSPEFFELDDPLRELEPLEELLDEPLMPSP